MWDRGRQDRCRAAQGGAALEREEESGVIARKGLRLRAEPHIEPAREVLCERGRRPAGAEGAAPVLMAARGKGPDPLHQPVRLPARQALLERGRHRLEERRAVVEWAPVAEPPRREPAANAASLVDDDDLEAVVGERSRGEQPRGPGADDEHRAQGCRARESRCECNARAVGDRSSEPAVDARQHLAGVALEVDVPAVRALRTSGILRQHPLEVRWKPSRSPVRTRRYFARPQRVRSAPGACASARARSSADRPRSPPALFGRPRSRWPGRTGPRRARPRDPPPSSVPSPRACGASSGSSRDGSGPEALLEVVGHAGDPEEHRPHLLSPQLRDRLARSEPPASIRRRNAGTQAIACSA